MAGVRGASGRRPAPAKLKLLNGRSPGRDSSGNLVKSPRPSNAPPLSCRTGFQRRPAGSGRCARRHWSAWIC
jgi:hypothetical protein